MFPYNMCNLSAEYPKCPQASRPAVKFLAGSLEAVQCRIDPGKISGSVFFGPFFLALAVKTRVRLDAGLRFGRFV